ncbi:queuosine precursor transporter [Paenibacillus sp.]|uniref:queuosine precursor transporter n=1 Tax=Paenibacillus sp. TaxID=58172 RepID=UPI002D542340|nr:queuosine precursor transporter [Paenibacillus sp.]HZG56218.1 queuosine precursor transporter [Paenibacillus sp.]
MFNVLWGGAFVVVNFALFLLCYRLFGRSGLYAWVGVATILANVQVVKTIEFGGIVMTLGNTIYATIFLATDLLNEKFGERAAKKAVWVGIFTLIASTVIMQMALVFEPHASNLAQPSLEAIFGLLPRLALGSLAAYFVSQLLDVKIFTMLKKAFPKPGQLWIRNNGSTAISQLLDTLVFCSIAFLGAAGFPLDVWWQIVLTTYGIKLIVSVASTPIIYWARGLRAPDT